MTTQQHWPPTNTIPCVECEGSGIHRGLFYSAACAACDGTGITDLAGGSLPPHTTIPLLKKQLIAEQRRHRQLLKTPGVQAAIDAEKQREHDRAQQRRHGYGNINTYNGD